MNRGGSSASASANYLLCTNCRKVLRKVRRGRVRQRGAPHGRGPGGACRGRDAKGPPPPRGVPAPGPWDCRWVCPEAEGMLGCWEEPARLWMEAGLKSRQPVLVCGSLAASPRWLTLGGVFFDWVASARPMVPWHRLLTFSWLVPKGTMKASLTLCPWETLFDLPALSAWIGGGGG